MVFFSAPDGVEATSRVLWLSACSNGSFCRSLNFSHNEGTTVFGFVSRVSGEPNVFGIRLNLAGTMLNFGSCSELAGAGVQFRIADNLS